MQMCTEPIRKTILSTRSEARESERKEEDSHRDKVEREKSIFMYRKPSRERSFLYSSHWFRYVLMALHHIKWIFVNFNFKLLSLHIPTTSEHFSSSPRECFMIFILLANLCEFLFSSCQVPLGCDSFKSMAIKTINKRIEAASMTHVVHGEMAARRINTNRKSTTLLSRFSKASVLSEPSSATRPFKSVLVSEWKKSINLKAGENRI